MSSEPSQPDSTPRSDQRGFDSWVESQLNDIKVANQWRALHPFDAVGPRGGLNGNHVVSFASNDYLGLSAHRAVVEAAHSALDRWGAGSTSSRLLVGTRPVHEELEQALAEWKKCESALAFPTGFAANLGVLATLGGEDSLVVSDELNHASIIDGCRLSRSRVAISRHNDVDHVEMLLRQGGHDRAIVVADAVFSMDGDMAPVDELAEVCVRHGALLILDEAHSIFGPDVDHLTAIEDLDLIRIVTFSKSLGAMGGAACGSRSVIDLLVNRCRSFIFTTGLSPADAAGVLAAIGVLRSAEGEQLISRLRSLTDRLSPGHSAPIVPLILGEETVAVAAAANLLERGIFVPAVRPPTVPTGSARLRITFSSAHTDEEVDQLIDTLDELELRR
ncbi:MAG: aminotransferase class I/II-fold pyridoxal phosphate-dependent enzyme [Acidimicrobiales bacterium]